MSDKLAKMLENKLNNVNNNNYLNNLSSTMDSVTDKFDKFGDKIHNYKQSLYDKNSNNRYIKYFIILFLAVYGSLAVNDLPNTATKLFDNNFFKFVYLTLLIGVFHQKEWTIAILLSLIYIISMRTLSISRINQSIDDTINYYSFKK
jgi:hypothetical protein